MSVEVGLEYVYDLADLLSDWQADGHQDADVQLSADGMSATVFVPEASIRGFSMSTEESPYVHINSMASRPTGSSPTPSFASPPSATPTRNCRRKS
jgi:hypothetical protein